jgi:hypothetical protein
MTSKNHGWQKRWVLDRSAGLAIHESGLAFRDGGMIALDLTPPEKWQEFNRHHGGHNAPVKIERMGREVVELFATARARDARL